jgi:hypothetical protein
MFSDVIFFPTSRTSALVRNLAQWILGVPVAVLLLTLLLVSIPLLCLWLLAESLLNPRPIETKNYSCVAEGRRSGPTEVYMARGRPVAIKRALARIIAEKLPKLPN